MARKQVKVITKGAKGKQLMEFLTFSIKIKMGKKVYIW